MSIGATRRQSPASISLRQSAIGGTLSGGKIDPPDLLATRDRILVLVHGFNVTEEDANRSYEIFERQLSADVRAQVVRLYWPGDSSTAADSLNGTRGNVSMIASAVSYMLKPPVAMRGSQTLRRMLQKAFVERRKTGRNKPLEICFVAHSLGCRLTLETIARVIVTTETDASLPLTVLMAAAVPEYMVRAGGTLADIVSDLPQIWVLHSPHDTVLRRFFRPGQFAERAPFPNFRTSTRRALGLKGLPSTDRIKAVEGRWDHSDYWTDRDIARAVDAELGGQAKLNHPAATLQRAIWQRDIEERVAKQRELAAFVPVWY